jgi:hypothetical protein
VRLSLSFDRFNLFLLNNTSFSVSYILSEIEILTPDQSLGSK